MAFKIHFALSFFALLCITNAFNITEILNKNPSYSQFNNYLTQTKVADAINSRQTLTVLAVSNDHLGALSGKPENVLTSILSLHVILDYYDVKKLQNLSNKTTILTTLYQASGKANGQMGFLNVTASSNGVQFGSAIKGANLVANLVDSVASEPYNISVLQISSPIIPPGIDNPTPSTPSAVPASSPRASPNQTPTPASSPSTTPISSSSPSTAPEASSPPAPTPEAKPSNAPAANAPGAASSMGAHVGLNLGAISVVVLSSVWLLA